MYVKQPASKWTFVGQGWSSSIRTNVTENTTVQSHTSLFISQVLT